MATVHRLNVIRFPTERTVGWGEPYKKPQSATIVILPVIRRMTPEEVEERMVEKRKAKPT